MFVLNRRTLDMEFALRSMLVIVHVVGQWTLKRTSSMHDALSLSLSLSLTLTHTHTHKDGRVDISGNWVDFSGSRIDFSLPTA